MKKSKLNNKKTRTIMSIVRSADIMNRYLEIQLTKHADSPIRFGVMNALFTHGGTMRPTNISKWIFRAKHSVTSMLKVLQNIGYVKRELNVDDHRSVNIIVTKKGWKATDKMIPIAEDISKQALSCLDEKEIDTLMDILKKIRKHLLANLL